ncbi:hypothetical protein L615_002700000090 [Nocardioides sp. J9]|nr:hypothetical protein L615_002700000090 [Nocardioides sp. J9]
MSPACFCASGSLRNSPNPQCARAAREHQIFCPLSTQPPRASSRRAVDFSEARSDPASGSLQHWAQTRSPVAIDGRKRSCCSFVPCSKMIGASRKMPFWPTRSGAPAR